MKNTYSIILVALMVAVIMACGGGASDSQEGISKEDRLESITSIEEELFADPASFNVGKAAALVKNYDMYATENPDDENAAEYLFKAGEMSASLNKGKEAVAFFDRVCNDYPDYERAAYALFMKGFTLENYVGDMGAAKTVYEDFIDKYPDHPMSESAKFSIQNLGKSPEDLIKEFEAKNQTENQES